ncbi:EF-hand domain-containing family member B-like [Saccoglossus kowalevskii]|uniref:EF-hand domain-containing family member B-like n=1 Tax=Saccoglossus kowalevskii TaxID=10224 RepID=A0ABM0MN31_SACKO|nr:PREDICTED: EF-hand domain-containing family member B-like [Saccoglossus kowalevskii]
MAISTAKYSWRDAVQSNVNRYTDRNPDIDAAGKLMTVPGHSAPDCLTQEVRPPTPDVVKKFKNFFEPDAGAARLFYGKANDPDIASTLVHGVTSKDSNSAGDLCNPRPKSLYEQRMVDKKEYSLYASKQSAPLGRSHDQSPSFPAHMDPAQTRFGIKNVFDGSAGVLVNPDKSRDIVETEGQTGHDLYIVTHNDYDVGEKRDRKYDWSRYAKDSRFGVPTPHDNDGRHVKKTLKWMHEAQQEKGSKIVSKRVDDFRERTQPQLGQVHDPIKDTMRVPPGHAYGVMIRPDDFGAGDLLHGRVPGEYLRGKDRERGVIAAIRQHLKKTNFHNFNDLQAAFRHYDKNGDGKIDINELRECCLQFNLPIEPELLEQLLFYCNANKDGYLDYTQFSNFLNWKDKMEELGGTTNDNNVETLQNQIDRAIGEHRTSASMINATVGGPVSAKGFRTYGVPTVRSDRPAPRFRRVSDRTNYGDESDAYGLVNPSIYSNRGVYERDFFKARPKDEVRTNAQILVLVDIYV